jgi:predicted RND superfamily exporter protein/lauroyl/myristoyl acyltransferase
MDKQPNRRLTSSARGVPVATFLLAGLLAVAGLWSAFSIRFQSELLPLFPQDLASVQALKRLQDDKGSQQEILLVNTLPADTNDPSIPALMRSLEAAMTAEGFVRSTAETQPAFTVEKVAGWLWQLPPEKFKRVVDALDPSTAEARLEAARSSLAGAFDEEQAMRFRLDPLGLFDAALPGSAPFAVLSESANPLRFTVPEEVKTFDACRRVTDRARQILARTMRGTVLEGHLLLTGHAVFTADISASMRRDMFVMLLFATTLTTGAFLLFYRSVRPLLAIVGIQMMGVLVAFAVAFAAFGQLNILSIAFSSILLGVGMDYCILVYHHFALGRRLDDPVWKELRRAIGLSSVTTAAVFGLLWLSSFPGLQQLSVLVGVGLLTMGWLATTLLAWWLSRLALPAPLWLVSASEGAASRLVSHRNHLRLLLLAGVVGAALCWPVLSGHTFYEPDLGRLQPRHLEAYRAQEFLVQEQVARWPFLRELDPTHEIANRAQWKSGRAQTLGTLFEKAGLSAEWAAPTLELAKTLDRGQGGAGADTRGAAEWWVQLRSDLNATALSDFRRLNLWAAAAMATLCWVVHRSLRLAGLNLLTLFVALSLLGLLLGLFQIPLTLMSLLCIPLLVGLVIDISLHLLLGLEHHQGDLTATFRSMAAPVMLTGITAAAGFGAPMLSSQPALQNFGLVMDLGIFSAVLAGLVLLPILYYRPKAATHHSRLYSAGCFELMAALASRIPRRTLLGIGWILGAAGALLHHRGRAVVLANLRLLVPGQTTFRLSWKTYISFTQTLADYFYLARRGPTEATALIERRIGREHFDEVHRQGKGCLLVTPHFGFFELGGVLLADLGYSVVALTQPEPNPRLGQWRADYRRRWGMETQEIGLDPFCFIQAANHLRNNKFVVALIDRPHPTQSVPVQLPGGTAHFSGGVLLLAQSIGCPVIVGTVIRQKNNLYQLVARPPFTIEKKGSPAETARYYSQKIMDELMDELCQHPEQWYQFVPLSS